MPRATLPKPTTTRSGTSTTVLLSSGLAAGPLFLLAAVAQGITREGFDLSHQPISFLSLGDLGWLQITNFLVTGVLVLLFATGVRRTLRGGAGGTFGPIGLVGLGLGLVVAGLFPPDPGFGYPVGTPDGLPIHTTYRSSLHGLGFTLSFLFFVMTALAFARQDLGRRRRWGVAYTLLSAVGALVLALIPGTNGIALRDLAAAVLLWTWVTVQAWRLRAGALD